METNVVATNEEFLDSGHGALSCEFGDTRARHLSCRSLLGLLGNVETVAFGLPDVKVFALEVMADCRRWRGLMSVIEHFPHPNAMGIPGLYDRYFLGCLRDEETYPNWVQNLQPMNGVSGRLSKCSS